MAHKTLIGGTQYGIKGGTTLVSGTSYSVKNGKTLIGGTAYDISFSLPPALVDLGEDVINDIIYANGYWVVVRSSSIAYTDSLNGEWTTKTLPVTTNCIAYANGYWVVGGQGTSASSERECAAIAYTTSLDGTWTEIDLWTKNSSGAQRNTVKCITYANGYWVIGGVCYNNSSEYSARIAYATSLDGTWTEKDVWKDYDYSSDLTCITYANGYWAVGGQCYDGGYIGCVAYTTSLSETWTTKNIYGPSDIFCIAYDNGYWVVGGTRSIGGDTYYATIAYTTSLSGTWTTGQYVWLGGEYSSYVRDIACANGYWVVCGRYWNDSERKGYARIAYATSPDGTWTIKDLWTREGGSTNITYNQSSNYLHNITYANGYWVTGGQYYDGNTSNTKIYRIAYASTPDTLGDTE